MNSVSLWKRRSFRKTVNGYLYISPWIIGFLLFFLIPLLYCLYISFCKFTITGDATFVGFKNYKFILTMEPLLWISLRQSILWTVFCTVFSTCTALLFAVLIFKGIKKGLSTVRAIFYLPVVLNAVAITTVIRYLTRHNGWANSFIKMFGLGPIDFWGNPVNAFLTILLAQIFFVGSTVVVYLAALSNIPKEMYESADIDGAGPVRKFFSITIPMISSMIYFNVITNVIFIFGSYNQPILYFFQGKTSQAYQAGPDNVMYHIGLLSFNYAFSWSKIGIASAIGWVMLIISFVFVTFIYKFGKSYVYYEAEK